MIRKEIKQDGTFGGNYPTDIEYPNLPENLIEITEEQRDCIDSNIEKMRYVDGEITDISDTQEYKDKIAQEQKEAQKSELQAQIDELEKTQFRAIREVALNKDLEFAMGKLQALDAEIAVLREQIGGL